MAQHHNQKTSASKISAILQFQALADIELDHVDTQTCAFRRFPAEREHQIDETLSDFIKPYVREADWNGRPCGVERFVDNVKEAIAEYETVQRASATMCAENGIRIPPYSTAGQVVKVFSLIEDVCQND